MIWPFTKRERKTQSEIDAEQRKADKARDDMDAMHARLEKAVTGLLSAETKEAIND